MRERKKESFGMRRIRASFRTERKRFSLWKNLDTLIVERIEVGQVTACKGGWGSNVSTRI